MSEVVTPLVEVKTGDSEVTVKKLRQEISKLRDTLLNVEAGSEEYNKSISKLQENQEKLNRVMSLSKKSANALDGSYDALVQQMSLLRKEWRATDDVARRNAIGEEINNINTQLKEMDASTGNFQRNVGDYANQATNAFKALKDEIKDARSALLQAEEGTEEYRDAMSRLANAQFQLRDMNEQSRYAVADFGEQLNNVNGIAQGVVAGFSALQAAQALLGNESEDLQKVMVKLQAGMALVQGLQGMEGMIDKVKGLGTAIKAVTKTMGKAGWIGVILAVVSAVSLLTNHLIKKNKELKNGGAALNEYKEVTKEAKQEVVETALEMKLLGEAASDASLGYDRQVIAAKKLLESMGLEINKINILKAVNGELATKIDEVTASMLKQAKAETAMEALKEKYKQFIEQEMNGPNFWDKVFTFDMSALFDGDGKFWNDEDFGLDRFNKRLEKTKTEIKQFEDTINADLKDALTLSRTTDVKTIQERANAEIEALELVYNKKISLNRNSEKSDEDKALFEYQLTQRFNKQKLGLLNKYADEARTIKENEVATDLLKQASEIEIEIQNNTYDEKERLRELDETKVVEYYDTLNNELERNYNTEIKLNNLSTLSSEEKAKKDYEITSKYLEDKKWYQEEYLAWLVQNEEKNKDEIRTIRENLADIEQDIALTNAEEQVRINQEMVNQINKELDKLDKDYEIKVRTVRAEGEKAGIENEQASRESESGFWNTLGSTLGVDFYANKHYKEEQQRKESEKQATLSEYDAEQEYLKEREIRLQEMADIETDATKKADIEKEIADTKVQIKESEVAEMAYLNDLEVQNEEENAARRKKIFDMSLNATKDLLNGIADMYEADGEVSEKEAKKIKGLRIATATIETLQGAITAFASAQQLGPIAGPIVGAANAAAVIAMGFANIKKIQQTDFRKGSSSNLGASVTPQTSTYAQEMPVQYTRNLTSASEIEELNKDQRVYILESDIQASNKRVAIRQSESSF